MDNLPHWGVVGYFPLTAAKRDGVLGLGVMAACTALARQAQAPVACWPGSSAPACPTPTRSASTSSGSAPGRERFDEFHKWLQRESPHRIPHEVLAGVGLAVLAGRLLHRG